MLLRDNMEALKSSMSREKEEAVPMLRWTVSATVSLSISESSSIRGEMNDENERAFGGKRKCTFLSRISNQRIKPSTRKKRKVKSALGMNRVSWR